MIRKNSKIINGTLIIALTIPLLGNFNSQVLAVNASEEKQYILIMDDERIYDEIAEEVGRSITVETPVLEENNIIVAELTESEAAILECNDAVLIEEDIVISASGFEENMDESQELMAEEAHRRKEEIKRRKQELLDEPDENEEIGTRCEWNLRAINAEEAVVSEEQSHNKIKVAVLDSGVDYVAGINMTGYVNFVEEEQEISPMFQDLTGHGTGIASIIAGNGENDIYGVNPNADLYSVKVLDKNNIAPLSRIIRGIYWCIENDMDIINMSFGTAAYSKALEQAVIDANEAGLLMIGAAGNGSGEVEYPAAFEEVMAVAATNTEAEISEFSNIGEEIDVAAPGEKIRVSGFFNGSLVTHGTSIAVPHVTGVASLLWEKDRTKSNEFIRQLIDYSAREIAGTEECGLLDAEYALDIYDIFAENFNETQIMQEEEIPKNTEKPETFEHIDADDAYVEGRWGGSNHQGAVDQGARGFSAEAVSIIKKGAVYPDTKNSGWKSGEINSRWHGKWEHFDEKYEINYIAVFEMVTEIAIEGGDIKSYMTYDWFDGMSKKVYSALKTDINNLKSEYVNLLPSNTKANRKYFLYGCGLHTMTDVFAHSTTKPNGEIIGHGYNNGTKPDDISYYHRRYKAAVKLTELALQSLRDDAYSCGYEVVKALNKEYTDEAAYKIIKIKKYVNENLFKGAVLERANIDEPIIPR